MKLFINFLVGLFSLCTLLILSTEKVFAYQIPPSVILPNSDMVVSKNNIIAVPYIMNDWENCNPETLKRGTDNTTDCWSHVQNVTPLPVNRPPYAAGSFGSHVTFTWDTSLNPSPGVYDWTGIDQYLQKASTMRVKDAQGNFLPFKPVIITFSEYLQNGGDPHDGVKDLTSYLPSYVKAALPQSELVSNLPGCDVQDMVPYHNQIFQQYYKQFMTDALAHLRQSPYNYVVQAYLMSGGVSSETTPSKNLGDCAYGQTYRDQHQDAWRQFINDSILWTDQVLRHGTSKQDVPAFLQAAAAWPNERYMFFRTAYPLGIGFKMNSMGPSNGNGINARPSAIGLYDSLVMTELTWPKGLEPVYPFRTPIAENCSSRYCDQNARYQGTYWMDLTALNYQPDMFDRMKEHFLWTREFVEQFAMPWFYGLMENSFGKAANQSRVAWVAFADRLNDTESYPVPRPSPPVQMGTGDYYRAEFTERGDRDFYLYRLGEIEDSTLIRRQAGVIPMDQNNYALAQNSCYKTQAQLPNQTTKILTGQELRSSGKLASSQFAHPFSATALTTEGASGKTQISLVLEDQVQSIKTNSTSITVEYLDAGTDQFALEYSNPQGQIQRETITKTNTNRWKSYQVTKSTNQITWQHRLTGGADLRLDCLCNSASGDDIFSMVRIESQGSPVRVAPSNTLSFCRGGGSVCTATADVNHDGVVNLLDLSAVIAHFGNTGTSAFDTNCDTVVDLLDFTLVISRMQF
ncbi:hypothetical protein KBC89_01570 [Candidatus Woesebacteria bacterium]|nr:hypothetical protein [Candidatus Woesebacteria bacterium]